MLRLIRWAPVLSWACRSELMTGATPTSDISDFAPPSTTQHATCVVAHNKGVLITGSSGSGKSSLALSMIGLGATLVADDRVILSIANDSIVATAPGPISGLIEARGIGLLHANTDQNAKIHLVIDLDQVESDRLPPVRRIAVMGHSVPLLYNVETVHFPAAIMQYLACGRQGE